MAPATVTRLPQREQLARRLCEEYFAAFGKAEKRGATHPQNEGWDAVADLVLADMTRIATLRDRVGGAH